MREILFRGKRKDNGEWVYGFYYEWHSKKYPNKKESWIHIIEHDKRNVKIKDEQYEIIPETVGQYMGLKVKGEEVYEGDILKRNKGIFIVEWDNEEVRFFPNWIKNEYDSFFFCDDIYDCKIIGDKHSNPELLEDNWGGGDKE